jgi:hypothetical protein
MHQENNIIKHRIMRWSKDKKGRRLRDIDGTPIGKRIGLFVGYKYQDQLYIGYCLCAAEDVYNPQKAYVVASCRAKASRKKALAIPPSILKDYHNFQERLVKYFVCDALPEFTVQSNGQVYQRIGCLDPPLILHPKKSVMNYLELMERTDAVVQKNVMHIDSVPTIKTPPISPFRQGPTVAPSEPEQHPVHLGDLQLGENIQLGDGCDDLPDYLKQEIL